MKNKKAVVRLGWKAEWIKEGGEKLVRSLYILFNGIKTENQIWKQWQLTIVKSIHKDGVKENIQENQRGIFLVNTVEIDMVVFMDDIAAVRTAGNIRKGIQNCRMTVIERKWYTG